MKELPMEVEESHTFFPFPFFSCLLNEKREIAYLAFIPLPAPLPLPLPSFLYGCLQSSRLVLVPRRRFNSARSVTSTLPPPSVPLPIAVDSVFTTAFREASSSVVKMLKMKWDTKWPGPMEANVERGEEE